MPKHAFKLISAIMILTAGFALINQSAEYQSTLTQTQVTTQKILTLKVNNNTVGVKIGKATAYKSELEEQEVTLREELKVRETFMTALAGFNTMVTAANGKTVVDAEHNAVLQAQKDFVNAKDKPSLEAQVAVVTTQTNAIKARIDAYDAEQARIAEEKARADRNRYADANRGGVRTKTYSNPGNIGGGDWFAQFRNLLTSIGGGWVELYPYDGSCGGKFARACSTPGVIRVNQAASTESSSRKFWTMTHELAHQYQFRKWGQIHASATYKNLFHSNIEKLANCMATVRGATDWRGSCTSAQLDYAATIW